MHLLKIIQYAKILGEDSDAMVTKNRLTVEIASRQVDEDCKEIRKRLNLGPIIRNPDDLICIKDGGLVCIEEKRREYAHYEIGFRFLVDHVAASLKDKINLSESEQELLMASMGRVFYNPPVRERLRMVEAAEMINKNEERGAQIIKRVKNETDAFLQMRKSVILGSDMFDNPIANVLGTATEANNFGDVAKIIRELIGLATKGSVSSGYYE